jgi:hypothetical protein
VRTAYKARAGEEAVPAAVHVLAQDYKYRIFVSWAALSILTMTAVWIVLYYTLLQTVSWIRAKFLEEKEDYQSRKSAWNLF